ncbi:MAG: M81 family metallopeptidase [Candidatus Aminicenantes bacterium]|nr:MAG: M81 family metallopeptidase [Candidatus Aminicenantes bacterium]
MKKSIVTSLVLILASFLWMTGCTGNKGDASSTESGPDTSKGPKKAFVAGLSTETNMFAPFPTDLSDFEREEGKRGGITSLFNQAAEQRGWNIVSGLIAGAPPAGVTTRSTYETLKGEILAGLKSALPVDMVVLALHGAMVAQGYDDCEGDFLQSIRNIVGKDVPIGAGLDPHAHLSETMVNAADILVFYKEWPHIDAANTYKTAFNLTADCAEGKIKPHIAIWDCRMIAVYHTLEEPTKGLIDDMKAAEGKDGIISVSLIHGFPYGDVPDMGTKFLVITDNLPEKGAELAEQFGRRLFAMRGKTGARQTLQLEESFPIMAKSKEVPVIVADIADMPGGGSPGDSTFFLKGMLDHGIDNSVIAGLWDPGAVAIALKLDVGDKLMMRIGGKTGPMSGDPLDLEVEVLFKSEDWKMTQDSGEERSYGAIAVVRVKGIDILLTKKRFPVYDYRLLEQLNLDPRNKRVIVVKSMNNFYAGFEPIMGSVLYVWSPGLWIPVVERQFKRIKRPKWPFDENPFEN